MTTKLIRCACKHEYQDSLYGKGMRIANEMRTGQLKCTVCGTISGMKGMSVTPTATEKVKSAATPSKPAAAAAAEPAAASASSKSSGAKKGSAGGGGKKDVKKEPKKKSLKGGKR